MCQGLKEWLEDERMEGKTEGKIEGKAEIIVDLLTEYGDVPEELRNRIMEEKDEELLFKWTKTAVKAASVEEFEKEMYQEQVY